MRPKSNESQLTPHTTPNKKLKW